MLEQIIILNKIFIDNPILRTINYLIMKETSMTGANKYKNVSLQKETYSILEKLFKVLLPDGKLSYQKQSKH